MIRGGLLICLGRRDCHDNRLHCDRSTPSIQKASRAPSKPQLGSGRSFQASKCNDSPSLGAFPSPASPLAVPVWGPLSASSTRVCSRATYFWDFQSFSPCLLTSNQCEVTRPSKFESCPAIEHCRGSAATTLPLDFGSLAELGADPRCEAIPGSFPIWKSSPTTAKSKQVTYCETIYWHLTGKLIPFIWLTHSFLWCYVCSQARVTASIANSALIRAAVSQSTVFWLALRASSRQAWTPGQRAFQRLCPGFSGLRKLFSTNFQSNSSTPRRQLSRLGATH
jgi:hypothetical protein